MLSDNFHRSLRRAAWQHRLLGPLRWFYNWRDRREDANDPEVYDQSYRTSDDRR